MWEINIQFQASTLHTETSEELKNKKEAIELIRQIQRERGQEIEYWYIIKDNEKIDEGVDMP